jgi:hypothetical protein
VPDLVHIEVPELPLHDVDRTDQQQEAQHGRHMPCRPRQGGQTGVRRMHRGFETWLQQTPMFRDIWGMRKRKQFFFAKKKNFLPYFTAGNGTGLCDRLSR